MTGDVLAEVVSASREHVAGAVAAARRAFDDGRWSDLPPRERAKFIVRLADLIDRDREQIALVESADSGKRLRGVLGWDVPNAAEVLRYYAGWTDKLVGQILPSGPEAEMLLRLEPAGVCALITTWNFPFACAAWKLAPALAAGCTVVLKSSERAPLSTQYLARLIAEAGLPKGVVNVVTGPGDQVGRDLVANLQVDKISFSGGPSTARRISAATQDRFLPLVLELGDKAPFIIFDDADLAQAIPNAVAALFGVSGQSCSAAPRILVHKAVRNEVLSALVAASKTRVLGDQLSDDTQQGPQVDRAHVDRIEQFVRNAVSEGAEIMSGGHPTLAGRFFEPTVLTATNSGMQIEREEVFGPVGTVTEFATVDEAIAIANSRQYGLAATVWTRNSDVADACARRIRSGTCWINCYEYFDVVAPWGGLGSSGTGKELGELGLREYLKTKTVVRTIRKN